MAVRATKIQGAGGGAPGGGVGRYYDRRAEIAALQSGRAGEYYDGSNIAAKWWGDGRQVHGLEGSPEAKQIAALIDGVSPVDGSQLGRVFNNVKLDEFGERVPGSTGSVRAYDVTFTVPKDVSVAWAAHHVAGEVGKADEVVEAMMASVEAVMAKVQADAYTRVKGVNVPVAGLTAAMIPEMTSRDGDPALHCHVVISAKVQDYQTGNWRALRGTDLMKGGRGFAGLFHAGMQTELTTRLGYDWGEQRGLYDAKLVGVPDEACEAFSKRTHGTGLVDSDGTPRLSITAQIAADTEAFTAEHGRAPQPRELHRIERSAAKRCRPSKPAEQPLHELVDQWTHELSTLERTIEFPDRAQVRRNRRGRRLSEVHLRHAKQAALAELSDGVEGGRLKGQNTFTRADLTAAISRNLPAGYGGSAAELTNHITAAVDEVLGQTNVRHLSDISVEPALRVYSPTHVLEQEQRILDYFDTAATRPSTRAGLAERLRNTTTKDKAPSLSAGQLEAAEQIGGTGQIVAVVGPAGAGKTTAIRTGTDHLIAGGHQVLALAPSAKAASQLGDSTGLAADTLARFLLEHTQRDNGPAEPYRLEAGATIVVDEAGMVTTNDFDQLTQIADQHNARLVLVGDYEQFSAVGRGGIFEHLTHTLPAGRVVELDEVFRFDQAWEGAGSLQIRAGNASIIDLYAEHGRITATTGDTITRTAVEQYMDHLGDGHQVGLYTPTIANAVALNTEIQQRLASAGRLGPALKPKTRHGETLHVGDRIVTRRNDSTITTHRGERVRNRDNWTITGNTTNGVAAVAEDGNRIVLPAAYVKDHVELGYAQTSMAAQGLTITKAISVYYDNDVLQRDSIYVPLTRGEQRNQAIVSTPNGLGHEAIDRLKTGIGRRTSNTLATAHTLEQNTSDLDRPLPSPPSLSGSVVVRREQLAGLGDQIESLSQRVVIAQDWVGRYSQDHDVQNLTENRQEADILAPQIKRLVQDGNHKTALKLQERYDLLTRDITRAEGILAGIEQRKTFIADAPKQIEQLTAEKQTLTLNYAANDPTLAQEAVAILEPRREAAVVKINQIVDLEVKTRARGGERAADFLSLLDTTITEHRQIVDQLRQLDPTIRHGHYDQDHVETQIRTRVIAVLEPQRETAIATIGELVDSQVQAVAGFRSSKTYVDRIDTAIQTATSLTDRLNSLGPDTPYPAPKPRAELDQLIKEQAAALRKDRERTRPPRQIDPPGLSR